MVIGDKVAGESWLNKPLAPYIDNTLGLKEKKKTERSEVSIVNGSHFEKESIS